MRQMKRIRKKEVQIQNMSSRKSNSIAWRMRTCSIFPSVRSESAKALMKEQIQSIFFKEHEVLPCAVGAGCRPCGMHYAAVLPLSTKLSVTQRHLCFDSTSSSAPRPSVKAIKSLMWPAPARLNERLQSSPGLCKIPLIEVDWVREKGTLGPYRG